jgi:hypothetical protein
MLVQQRQLLLLLCCYNWSKGNVSFASGSPFTPTSDEAGTVHCPAGG